LSATAATSSSRAAMLIRLIISPADENRSGANQMRQHLSFREHFRRGNARVASHRRSLRPHRPSTVPEHMPSAHRRYRDWTHERIRHEAQTVGPDAAVLIDVILR